MQIQRIQTLFLLLAAILTCIFCVTPYAQIVSADGSATGIYAKDTPVLLVVDACIAVLLLLNIFMYKNLRRQMSLTLVAAFLLAGAIASAILIVAAGMEGASLIWTGGVAFLVLSIALTVCAYRFMLRDKRKLASYDRLR